MLYGHFNPFIIIESLLLFLATVACLQYTKGITIVFLLYFMKTWYKMIVVRQRYRKLLSSVITVQQLCRHQIVSEAIIMCV